MNLCFSIVWLPAGWDRKHFWKHRFTDGCHGSVINQDLGSGPGNEKLVVQSRGREREGAVGSAERRWCNRVTYTMLML